MDVYRILQEMNLELPPVPPKGGVYSPYRIFGERFVYVSGCAATVPGKPVVGRLQDVYSVEEGQQFAKMAMLNVLAIVEQAAGDLNRVVPVKILTFVSGPDGFGQQPQVANGGSQLLSDLFGEGNVPARSAIGVNTLPGNTPVETEGLFEIVVPH